MTTLPDLRDVDAFLTEANQRTLQLPVGGKVYEFSTASLTFRAGLLLQRMRVARALFAQQLLAGENPDPFARTVTEEEEAYLYNVLVPPEMVARFEADDLKIHEVDRIRDTLVIWLLDGMESATRYWSTGSVLAPEADANPPADPASMKTAGSSTRKQPAARRRSTGATSSARGTSSKPASRRRTTKT